jgi:hypothetical protein
MNHVIVKKERLLETLKANRETHRADFDLAWDGFREKAIANATALVDSLKSACRGDAIELYLNLETPIDHTADYDRAIEMIDWEVGDEVQLTQNEFSQFVQDDWSWKRQFAMSNTTYTGSASPSSVALPNSR